MDNGVKDELTLRRLPHGGFVVCDAYRPNEWTTELLASTSIDEALQFMRDKINPIPPQQEPARG